MRQNIKFAEEIREELTEHLIPFWKKLMDTENGGFYGYMDYGLTLDQKAGKGCILNSRILWFFSNAYMLLGDAGLLEPARHAYVFLRDQCLDKKYGGVYWMLTADGRVQDATKHTYNQAFAIYALASYYDAVREPEVIGLAWQLYERIETRCVDEGGYREAFSEQFEPVVNEKLSENGVLAERTMNTLLHVFEAYTELHRVTGDERAAGRMRAILETFEQKIYNETAGRQEVFFDRNWKPLIDLYSYGHDIETAWLVDRGLEVLGDEAMTRRLSKITKQLTKNIYERAFTGHSVVNEAENGVVDTTRVWWVQAEAVVGFVNGFQKEPEKVEYLRAAEDIWNYIKRYLIDPRPGSEWFWSVDETGTPLHKPIVEPWKCPYHNGRMCIEIIKRKEDCHVAQTV